MTRQLHCDFHIHSCLSPCGSEDMTPNNIVNMALLSGRTAIALTDHNSCQNCPATAAVAQDAGLAFLPGMELSTAEEIHVVFLFPEVKAALEFDAYVSTQKIPLKNKPHIFGRQLVLDHRDTVVREEETLLITATNIPIDNTPELARQFGGLCYPAHIDRSSYSILSNLGFIPPEYAFRALEVHQPQAFFSDPQNLFYQEHYPILSGSDAHDLESLASDAPFIFSAHAKDSLWDALTAFLLPA